jgi:hypothetical protein
MDFRPEKPNSARVKGVGSGLLEEQINGQELSLALQCVFTALFS